MCVTGTGYIGMLSAPPAFMRGPCRIIDSDFLPSFFLVAQQLEEVALLLSTVKPCQALG
jgi:hypothetical protein